MPDSTTMKIPIKVTAAVMIRQGKILVAQRKKEKHMGLKWEFPGGKIKTGESPETCLERELEEEFSIQTRVHSFFHSNIHHYPEKSVELISFLVEYLSGQFQLRDHQAIRWVNSNELKGLDFAEADLPIVEKILNWETQLPSF